MAFYGGRRVLAVVKTEFVESMPKLNAPTIQISGRLLKLKSPSTNGNFFQKFKIFSDGLQKGETTEKEIDLYTLFTEDGTYTLTAKCASQNFKDSDASAGVSYTKIAQTTGLVWLTSRKLSSPMQRLAATSIGNYALFGGGINGSTCLNSVFAYDASLTETTPSELIYGRQWLAATSVGNYAIFGGGMSGNDQTSVTNHYETYDTSLTHNGGIDMALSLGRNKLAATSVGNYALFGGGASRNNIQQKTVDAFDTSLTQTIPTVLSVARYELAATSVGNYALFGGGTDNASNEKTTVEAYDTSLTQTIPTVLSLARSDLAATRVGNYALFGGGYNSNGKNTVDAYDASLTRTKPTGLSVGRYDLAATSIGDYALFGGGRTSGTMHETAVDAYDTSLTRTIPMSLTSERCCLAATSIGNYALFGGGSKNTLDVYTVLN